MRPYGINRVGWVVRVVVCLLVGCALSFGVVIAVLTWDGDFTPSEGDSTWGFMPGLQLIRGRNDAWVDSFGMARAEPGARERFRAVVANPPPGLDVSPNMVDELPSWLDAALAEPISNELGSGRTAHALGWPRRQAVGYIDHELDPSSPTLWRSTIDRLGWEAPWNDAHGDPVRIPTIVLWQGLAVNTVVWALAPAALLIAAPLARRWVRAHRGLCSRCGYPRGGSAAPCAECGHRGRAKAG